MRTIFTWGVICVSWLTLSSCSDTGASDKMVLDSGNSIHSDSGGIRTDSNEIIVPEQTPSEGRFDIISDRYDALDSWSHNYCDVNFYHRAEGLNLDYGSAYYAGAVMSRIPQFDHSLLYNLYAGEMVPGYPLPTPLTDVLFDRPVFEIVDSPMLENTIATLDQIERPIAMTDVPAGRSFKASEDMTFHLNRVATGVVHLMVSADSSAVRASSNYMDFPFNGTNTLTIPSASLRSLKRQNGVVLAWLSVQEAQNLRGSIESRSKLTGENYSLPVYAEGIHRVTVRIDD